MRIGLDRPVLSIQLGTGHLAGPVMPQKSDFKKSDLNHENRFKTGEPTKLAPVLMACQFVLFHETNPFIHTVIFWF